GFPQPGRIGGAGDLHVAGGRHVCLADPRQSRHLLSLLKVEQLIERLLQPFTLGHGHSDALLEAHPPDQPRLRQLGQEGPLVLYRLAGRAFTEHLSAEAILKTADGRGREPALAEYAVQHPLALQGRPLPPQFLQEPGRLLGGRRPTARLLFADRGDGRRRLLGQHRWARVLAILHSHVASSKLYLAARDPLGGARTKLHRGHLARLHRPLLLADRDRRPGGPPRDSRRLLIVRLRLVPPTLVIRLQDFLEAPARRGPCDHVHAVQGGDPLHDPGSPSRYLPIADGGADIDGEPHQIGAVLHALADHLPEPLGASGHAESGPHLALVAYPWGAVGARQIADAHHSRLRVVDIAAGALEQGQGRLQAFGTVKVAVPREAGADAHHLHLAATRTHRRLAQGDTEADARVHR